MSIVNMHIEALVLQALLALSTLPVKSCCCALYIIGNLGREQEARHWVCKIQTP